MKPITFLIFMCIKLMHMPLTNSYVLVCGKWKTNIFTSIYCMLCREIFCIDFHLSSVLLLLKGVEKKNMWGDDGLIGSEGLRSFSWRRNCNSGSYSVCLVLLYGEILCELTLMQFFSSFLSSFGSKTSTSERALVIGLGGLNLFGVIVLGTMLK